MKQKIIEILGTPYKVNFKSLEDCSGLTDFKNKEISIDTEVWNAEKTILHELIHAFLYESGLHNNSDWAINEECIDWFAIQFDKILKVREEILKEHL